MENLDFWKTLKICLICAGIALLGGLILSLDLSFVLFSTFLAFVLPIKLVSVYIYEYTSSDKQIRFFYGKIGIAYIKLAIKLLSNDAEVSVKEKAKLNQYISKDFNNEILDAVYDYIDEKKNIKESVNLICKPIKNLKYSKRTDVLYRLFKIVAASKIYNEKKDSFLKEIADELSIGKKSFTTIKKSVIKEKSNKTNSQQEQTQQSQSRNFYIMDQLLKMAYNPYVILGIEQNASNEEVKHAYRNLAKKYHPDKAVLESEEIRKQDALKMIEINEAYESIKKMRGIK